MNWTKLAPKALTALPKIQQTVEAIGHIHGTGQEKKDAVLTAILGSLDVAQSVTDKDILNDPRVIAVLGKANDIAIEVQNVISAVTAEHKLIAKPIKD